MPTRDTTDRDRRLAGRNALIQAIFAELTTHDGLSFMQAYVFLGTILASMTDRYARSCYKKQ